MSLQSSRSLPSSIINRKSSITVNATFDELDNDFTSSVRTNSISHRPTISGVPHTLVCQPSHERQLNLAVRPTLIRYNHEKIDESTYSSMDQILPVPQNENLWIDVSGVSEWKYSSKKTSLPCLSRFMIENFSQVLDNDLKFIH